MKPLKTQKIILGGEVYDAYEVNGIFYHRIEDARKAMRNKKNSKEILDMLDKLVNKNNEAKK